MGGERGFTAPPASLGYLKVPTVRVLKTELNVAKFCYHSIIQHRRTIERRLMPNLYYLNTVMMSLLPDSIHADTAYPRPSTKSKGGSGKLVGVFNCC